MNKRQRRILVWGVFVTVLVPVVGTAWLHPPVVGPRVEYAPGHFSTETMDAVTPKWALLASLGVAVLTAAAVHRSRTRSDA